MSNRIQAINIGRAHVGMGRPPFIIAEAGVNHNGALAQAKKLVMAAKRSGADCIKFQTFKAERVVTLVAPKAAYQLKVTSKAESQYEMLKKLELSDNAHHQLLSFCKKMGIIFLSTPYSIEDVDFLHKLGVPAFKIASGQIVELPFLRYVASKGKPILLSTGMSTLREIGHAVKAMQSAGNSQVILLQCTTNYPSRIEDANLLAMGEMRKRFNLNVGYSDHTDSISVAIAASALGACVIEKHFTLDKHQHGPDHSSSATPKELFDLVEGVRQVEKALGTGSKKPSRAELVNLGGMRRSIVAKVPIKAGENFSLPMLCFKRPATGLSPVFADRLVGRRAVRDIPADCFISLKDAGL